LSTIPEGATWSSVIQRPGQQRAASLHLAVAFFEVCREITEVATFAVDASIRELPRLRGMRGKGRWRKRNAGFEASLERRKLSPILDDPDAAANHLLRVIDESGDDYLYPARLFQRLAS